MTSHCCRTALSACIAAALALLATGCAAPGSGNAGITASENSVAKVSNVGFLSEPAKLKVQPANGGFLCWRQAGIDWKSYDKVMIERIQVYVTPGERAEPDRSERPQGADRLLPQRAGQEPVARA